jgi:cell wall-associated NlpC family hydrolase
MKVSKKLFALLLGGSFAVTGTLAPLPTQNVASAEHSWDDDGYTAIVIDENGNRHYGYDFSWDKQEQAPVQAPQKYAPSRPKQQPAEKAPAQPASNLADQVIAAGEKYLGTPYEFGASSSTTSVFDCSSFTQRAFKDVGIQLPRNSRQQSKVGQPVAKSELQKGDLVFFRTAGSNSDRITHVAIYAGNNKLLHTFGKPGVTFTEFAGTSWEKRFVTARRVL